MATWRDNVDGPGARTRLTRHLLDGDTVTGSTTSAGREALRAAAAAAAVGLGLTEARTLTVDEYTLASVMASEDGASSPDTLASIGDATLNRAARASGSVEATATAGHGFGHAAGGRPMTTALAPQLRHVRVAIALTRGGARGPRGVARGAYLWLHWQTQAALARRSPATNCPPEVILERWCFECAWADEDASGRRTSCRLGPHRRAAVEWIGRTTGVDAERLLLFRPATAAHAAQYAAARAIVTGARPIGWRELAAAAAVLAAAAVGVRS